MALKKGLDLGVKKIPGGRFFGRRSGPFFSYRRRP
jgi:hypothetical protein